MGAHVSLERTGHGEGFGAGRALEGTIAGVNSLVILEVARASEGAGTQVALEGPLSGVGSHVVLEGARNSKGLRAQGALVRSLPGMDSHVLGKIRRGRAGLGTKGTLVGSHPSVCAHMAVEGTRHREGAVALGALEGPHIGVGAHVDGQIAYCHLALPADVRQSPLTVRIQMLRALQLRREGRRAQMALECLPVHSLTSPFGAGLDRLDEVRDARKSQEQVDTLFQVHLPFHNFQFSLLPANFI